MPLDLPRSKHSRWSVTEPGGQYAKFQKQAASNNMSMRQVEYSLQGPECQATCRSVEKCPRDNLRPMGKRLCWVPAPPIYVPHLHLVRSHSQALRELMALVKVGLRLLLEGLYQHCPLH